MAAGAETEEGVGGTNSSHPPLRMVARAVSMAAVAKAPEAVDRAVDNRLALQVTVGGWGTPVV